MTWKTAGLPKTCLRCTVHGKEDPVIVKINTYSLPGFTLSFLNRECKKQSLFHCCLSGLVHLLRFHLESPAFVPLRCSGLLVTIFGMIWAWFSDLNLDVWHPNVTYLKSLVAEWNRLQQKWQRWREGAIPGQTPRDSQRQTPLLGFSSHILLNTLWELSG